MARKKANPKFVGSCGMYLVVNVGDGRPKLLCHRRSRQVSEPNTIAAPGGIVERHMCGLDCSDFAAGARATAVRELAEETGVRLEACGIDAETDLLELPVGICAWWGPEMHRNYCAVVQEFPRVTGPEKASVHEMVPNGMVGIGQQAGDGYSAWVAVEDLLKRGDLMQGCRVPLERLQQMLVEDSTITFPVVEEEKQEEQEPSADSGEPSELRAKLLARGFSEAFVERACGGKRLRTLSQYLTR